jgi:hypothetical protein
MKYIFGCNFVGAKSERQPCNGPLTHECPESRSPSAQSTSPAHSGIDKLKWFQRTFLIHDPENVTRSAIHLAFVMRSSHRPMNSRNLQPKRQTPPRHQSRVGQASPRRHAWSQHPDTHRHFDGYAYSIRHENVILSGTKPAFRKNRLDRTPP